MKLYSTGIWPANGIEQFGKSPAAMSRYGSRVLGRVLPGLPSHLKLSMRSSGSSLGSCDFRIKIPELHELVRNVWKTAHGRLRLAKCRRMLVNGPH